MLDEAPGPMNFTQMVTLFAGKMAGGTDDDETILKSFEVSDAHSIDIQMLSEIVLFNLLLRWLEQQTNFRVLEER